MTKGPVAEGLGLVEGSKKPVATRPRSRSSTGRSWSIRSSPRCTRRVDGRWRTSARQASPVREAPIRALWSSTPPPCGPRRVSPTCTGGWVMSRKPTGSRERSSMRGRHNDEEIDLLELVGWCQLRLGLYRESVETLRRALQLDGRWTAVRFDLALALMCVGDRGRAFLEYQRGSIRRSTGASNGCEASSAWVSTTSRSAWSSALHSRRRARRSPLATSSDSPPAGGDDDGLTDERSDEPRPGTSRPLRHRDFRLLWTGMTASLIGDGDLPRLLGVAGLRAVEHCHGALDRGCRDDRASDRLPARGRRRQRSVRPASRDDRGRRPARRERGEVLGRPLHHRQPRALARPDRRRGLRRRHGVLRAGFRRDRSPSWSRAPT